MRYPFVVLSVDTVITIFLFLIGAVFGSFGNVLILRLPAGKSIGGRSACPHCKKILGILELIPIVSFLVLRGRCSKCRKPISWQYPLVEVASGLLFVYAFFYAAYIPHAILLSFTLWFLLLIAVTDLRLGMIPDAFNIPFLLLGVTYGVWTDTFTFSALLLGSGVFAFQWIVSRGKWVGSGDIILGAGMGALLGTWPRTLLALWFAYVIGAVFAAVLLFSRKKTMNQWISFGPFLALGTLLSLMFGERILNFIV